MAVSTHWINHIEAWQNSDQNQASYCRQHKLNAKSFSGRISEYKKQSASLSPALIPVQVTATEQPSLSYVVVFTKQDYQLELPSTISAQRLAELLQCLNLN